MIEGIGFVTPVSVKSENERKLEKKAASSVRGREREGTFAREQLRLLSRFQSQLKEEHNNKRTVRKDQGIATGSNTYL
jgi:hypothetical protein